MADLYQRFTGGFQNRQSCPAQTVTLLFCLGWGLAERQGQKKPSQQPTLTDFRNIFISSTGVAVKTLLKTIHFLGLSLFLGSVVSYIVIGVVAESPAAQAFSRTYGLQS
ncbi:hypothetical protein [Verminephrobacter aporrectodeae]|uniref:hypothetical protein n=1 Tax=Verminephrobacter aporrectodeae TaxID=1110389 RepID=UPI0022448A10|nr:hypothetical protein [Verminephrobacter aporrectodeae]